MKKLLAAGFIGLALSLVGCGASQTQDPEVVQAPTTQSPSETPTETPTEAPSDALGKPEPGYSSLQEIRNALIAGGVSCDSEDSIVSPDGTQEQGACIYKQHFIMVGPGAESSDTVYYRREDVIYGDGWVVFSYQGDQTENLHKILGGKVDFWEGRDAEFGTEGPEAPEGYEYEEGGQ